MAGNENVEYRSVLPPSPRMRTLLRVILGLGVLLSATSWLFQPDQVLACLLATVILIGIPALLASSHGVVTVAAGRLRLTTFPLFTKSVPLRDVESVRVATVDPWRDYNGLGYRLAANGEVGFAFRAGPAVQVWMRGGRVYVVGDPDAERLADVLRSTLADRN